MLHLLALTSVPADVRHDLQALHDRMARQYVTKGYDEMVALANARFAPEFAYAKLLGPSMNLLSLSAMRDDEMRNLAAGRGDGPTRWRTRLDGWGRKGDVLTVLAHHDVDGEWRRADGRHPVHFRSTVRETWVRRDGEWKAFRWRELWLRGVMDGRFMELGRRPETQDLRAGTAARAVQ